VEELITSWFPWHQMLFEESAIDEHKAETDETKFETHEGTFTMSLYCYKCSYTTSSLVDMITHCLGTECRPVMNSLSFDRFQDLFERKYDLLTCPALPGSFPGIAT